MAMSGAAQHREEEDPCRQKQHSHHCRTNHNTSNNNLKNINSNNNNNNNKRNCRKDNHGDDLPESQVRRNLKRRTTYRPLGALSVAAAAAAAAASATAAAAASSVAATAAATAAATIAVAAGSSSTVADTAAAAVAASSTAAATAAAASAAPTSTLTLAAASSGGYQPLTCSQLLHHPSSSSSSYSPSAPTPSSSSSSSSSPSSSPSSSSSRISRTLEKLLWPYHDDALNVAADCKELFPASKTNFSELWDFAIYDAAFTNVPQWQAHIKPGGVVVLTGATHAQIGEALREVAFRKPLLPPDFQPAHPWRATKLATILTQQGQEGSNENEEEKGLQSDGSSTSSSTSNSKEKKERREQKPTKQLENPLVVLHLPGSLDDNDHLALGDYGNEYGEYRWGVFNRFVWRLFPRASPEPDAYFRKQMAIMELPVEAVFVDLNFGFEERAGELRLRSRAGAKLQLPVAAFRSALVSDLSFGLAVHPGRLEVEVLQGGWARLIIRDAEVGDYPLHRKQRPWSTWAAYFGRAAPQPLIVVAQTAREKSRMVADDLSDFYTGAVTQALPEGNVKVGVVSRSCSDFIEALEMHHLHCQAPDLQMEERQKARLAPKHSVLYSLAAKEKLSGELGVAAESSLLRIFKRTKSPLPTLVALILEGEGGSRQAAFGVFEGRTLSRGSLKKLVAKLPQGFDVLQTSSCSLPELAVQALVPGGLIFIENLIECSAPSDFDKFLERAAALGSVSIGRNIAVVAKSGEFEASKTRAAWPQKRLKSSDGATSEQKGEALNRLAFLRKVVGLTGELEHLQDEAYQDPPHLRQLLRAELLQSGRTRGDAAAVLDKLGEAEILFRELDLDRSGSVDEEEFGKLQEVRKKKKLSPVLSKQAKRAKDEDAEVRRSTPRSDWPKLVTAQDVQHDFRLDGAFTKVMDPPPLRPRVENPCGLQLANVKSLRFFRHGTREDGQAMVMYLAEVDGRRFIFKLGRFVDLAREALVSQRLTSCGSTSFAKTCGLIAASNFQDGAGLWREGRNWKTQLQVPDAALDWLDLEQSLELEQLGHCQDCLYSRRDAAGSYLKDGSMRAHIELCPEECVVWQVQEFIEGLSLEHLAWPYRSDFAPGHERKETDDPKKEKQQTRRTIERWLSAAEVFTQDRKAEEKAKALTELVVARIFAAFVHFHAKCGVVHDDMHVGNVVLTNETGQVKVIDWELARIVKTDPASLSKLWNQEADSGKKKKKKKPGLIDDRATQCDSLFKGCVCEWPWQALATQRGQSPRAHTQKSAACNLFGIAREDSVALIEALVQQLPTLSSKFLGEHGASLKEELRRVSEAGWKGAEEL